LVRDSSITVLAPPTKARSVESEEEEEVNFKVWPIVVAPGDGGDLDDEDDEARRLERKAQFFARLLQKKGAYTYDTRSSSNLNVEMTWPGEDPFWFPSSYQSPSLLASRSFSGYGQERGQIEVLLRNSEPVQERTVTYFDVLPWFIKPYLHTLSIEVEADDFDEEEDNVVRFQDEITAPLLLSLEYTPSLQRQRPFHLEARIRVPPQSTVRLTIDYDKAFLRYAEHPPDAHRGFDVAPAIVILEDRSKIYTNPALIEVAVPDFSMPYNVM
jgi:phosphatidylinositol glycan class T